MGRQRRATLLTIATARGASRVAFMVTVLAAFLLVTSALVVPDWRVPLLAWGLVAIAGLAWLIRLQLARTTVDLRLTEDTAPAPPGDNMEAELARAALNALSHPLLIVGRDMRIIGSNMVARATFSNLRQGALLTSVMRMPEVLEAVEEVLHGRDSAVVQYQQGGVDERFMRAHIAAAATANHNLCAFIELRDDTEAQTAAKTRTRFLANASHELRTPLASLSGFIETLRGHARDDPEAREHFLGIMAKEAERMRRLIDDLLSLSRIEQNERVAPTGVADLAAICNDVSDSVMHVAARRGITLECNCSAQMHLPVRGDRDELVQVVQNLLDNAVKYSPDNTAVGLWMRSNVDDAGLQEPASLKGASDPAHLMIVTPRASDTGYAVIEFWDHGEGIPRANLPQLSQRFFRVDRGLAAQIPGTGLGLAIVKHVIARHRGALSITSEEGVGSVFRIALPQAKTRTSDLRVTEPGHPTSENAL